MNGRIVVGVDGSETARRAAHWAAEEAKVRGADLDLVMAWEVPVSAYGYGFAVVNEDMIKGFVKQAEDCLADAVEAIRPDAPNLHIETNVVEGNAAEMLLRASRDADLLVVGSRGLGGFRELLLGSVSQHCAHHATCPVVIVRHVHEDA
ncbi:MAG TPA: universal stress protein [Actinomycetota bacterium]|jgi:nucleotide-binding universal stress UspA family protein